MTTPSLPRSRGRFIRPLAAGATLATALLVGGCGRPEPMGDLLPMPEFELASLGGEAFGKADFAGKVVLFDFWATWCGPCHLQADILRELYPQVARKGIEFVAISTGEEIGIVRDFVRRKPFLYAVFVDPEESLGNLLEIGALPTLVVMDREGRIAYRHTGIADAETILAALDKAEAAARN